jgi:CheY-like chemotaxis protein
MYAEYLRHYGVVVEEAEDGPEALAKAIAVRPEVIVADALLPGIGGYKLCRTLRQTGATRTIPVVIVTADARPRSLSQGHESGADSVLVKPCLPETLHACIQELAR